MVDETYHALTSLGKINPIVHAQGSREICFATLDLLTIVGCAWGQVDSRPVCCAKGPGQR